MFNFSLEVFLGVWSAKLFSFCCFFIFRLATNLSSQLASKESKLIFNLLSSTNYSRLNFCFKHLIKLSLMNKHILETSHIHFAVIFCVLYVTVLFAHMLYLFI